MNNTRQVCVVCTGNICRSPMAVGLLRRLWDERKLSESVQASSAGVRALEGYPASPHAIAAMDEMGIDITGHRAQQLSRHHIESADLLLVMNERHRSAILDLSGPQALFKTLLISELVGKHHPIHDPYGFPLETYRACAAELDQILTQGMSNLLERIILS